jgi:hypothetical protein
MAQAKQEVRRTAGPASVAWITLFGALMGVTALIPIFPYVGGGGYVPLATPFGAIAPLLLGPVGGVVSAIVGGLVGMFLAPAAFPLGLADVGLNTAIPAFLVGLVVLNNRYWKIAIPVAAVVGVAGTLFPFYIPGAGAGFDRPPEPLFSILYGVYWVPSLIILISPIGRRLIPNWALSSERRQKYLGIFLAILTAMWLWWLPWTRPYQYLFRYTPEVSIATAVGYLWWIPALSLVITAITIPLLEALSRSGLPKVRDAVW